jgi:hypothetical protein
MTCPRIRTVAAIALAVLVVSPTTARAATFNLLSPHVIALNGTVELGDCDRWKAAIKPTVHTVVLNSPGGRNGQGECISRSIAERRMKAFVQGKCASICFLLFAAGAEKWACDGAKIGVHRPSDPVTRQEGSDPTFLRTIIEYAARYHVPRAIQEKLSETSSRDMYWLSDSDLASMNVKRC